MTYFSIQQRKLNKENWKLNYPKNTGSLFLGGRLFLCSICKIKDVIGGCGVKRCLFISPPPSPCNCRHVPLKRKVGRTCKKFLSRDVQAYLCCMQYLKFTRFVRRGFSDHVTKRKIFLWVTGYYHLKPG